MLDATEALLIEYDPKIITFRGVLAASTKIHNPFIKPRKRQYRTAIWVQNQKQRKDAMLHIENLSMQQQQHYSNGLFGGKKQNKIQPNASSKPRKVDIDVEDVGPFYRAEEYHQDYIDKHCGIFD